MRYHPSSCLEHAVGLDPELQIAQEIQRPEGAWPGRRRLTRDSQNRRLTRDSRNRRRTRDFHTRPKIGFFYRKTGTFYCKNDQEKISEIFVHVAPEKT